MTPIIDESEEISSDLLISLLASVRKDNQNVSSVSWKSEEQIITRINAWLDKRMALTKKLTKQNNGTH